jgi:hypothetical protein
MARGGGFERARLDGFRLDAVKHVPLDFWAAWTRDVSRGAPGLTLLGEMLDGDPSVVSAAWRDGGFTAMFDFPLGFAMNDVFCRDDGPAKLAAVLSNDRRYPDPSQLVTLLDNHDLPRVMSTCGNDAGRVRQALAFMLAMRGVPSLTWGTEVGLDGAKEPENRKSMVFQPHVLKDDIGFWLAARRRNPALSEGVPVVLSASGDGVVIGRVTPSQLAVVVVGRGGVRPRPESPVWSEASVELAPPKALKRTNVGVFVSAVKPNAWEGLFREADAQWRRAGKTRAITFEGPAGTRLVGSGPELGDWNPTRARPLPLTVELPEGGVFEFKAVRSEGAKVVWAEGANGLLFVEPSGPSRVQVRAAFSR